MSADFYRRDMLNGCIEYDFTRADPTATRVSAKICPSRKTLIAALDARKHKWEGWS